MECMHGQLRSATVVYELIDPADHSTQPGRRSLPLHVASLLQLYLSIGWGPAGSLRSKLLVTGLYRRSSRYLLPVKSALGKGPIMQSRLGSSEYNNELS